MVTNHQQANFINALAEQGIAIAPDFAVDHKEATCTNNGVIYGLIWPKSTVEQCVRLWDNTRPVYACFRGVRTKKRNWVEQVVAPQGKSVNIEFTSRGRTVPKGYFDVPYFTLLAQSENSLCPSGEVPWTYRLIESVFCGAIPVTNGDSDIHNHLFTTYDQPGDYCIESARRNLWAALMGFTIIPEADKVQMMMQIMG